MKISDDVPVGELATYKNKTYKVVAQYGCEFCAFNYKRADWCIDKNPKCDRLKRTDHTDVIFIRVAEQKY